MMRTISLLFSVFLFISCTVQKPLYYWDKYESMSYNYLKNSNEKSIQEMIETYQRIIENQKGLREMAPPGIYADYGFMLIQENRIEEGKAMLEKEVSLYPEAKVFIDRVLKMMEE